MNMLPPATAASCEHADEPGWLRALADADTPRDIATLVVGLAQRHPQCQSARVYWAVDPGDAIACEPPQPTPTGMLDWIRAAAALGTAQWTPDQRRVAIPLSNRPDPAVLVLDFSESQAGCPLPSHWAESLRLADRHLRRAQALDTLQASVGALERSNQLQRALFAISDLAGSERDMQQMLRGIHEIIGSLMYAENFFIVLHDAERDSLRFLYFADVVDPAPFSELPMDALEHTFTWYLIRHGKPLMGSTEQLRQQVPGTVNLVGTDSFDWLGVPMMGEDRVYGALVVQSYEESVRYSEEDRSLLGFVASHVLTALERKQSKDALEQRVHLRTLELADANRGLQLEVEERQRAERLQAALFRIAELATADISQAEFYRQVHAVVGTLINARNFFIALLSDDGSTLEYPYSVDESSEQYGARPVGRGLSEYVIRHGTSIFQGNDILALADRGEVDLDTVGSLATWWLGVPLQVGDAVIGLVAVQSYTLSAAYSDADKELLTFVASQIANSLSRRRAAQIQQQAFAQLEQRVQERTGELRREIQERQRAQEQLKHQVMHDALTGLPNRGYLRERLERVLALLKRAPHRKCALLYLDVDRFKVINDSLGHLAGDAYLKEIAQRLQACVREPDLVARLAGDEFAILLEDAPVPGTAVRVAQRVLEALALPLQMAGRELEPSASIGIAIADSSYQLADEVLRDADVALYRAKALGRKRFELFDASLQKHAVDVLTMERELRVALQKNQFVPYFQPILRLDTDQVQGYEALIRWNHPVRGLIGPGEFLRIAEDSGNIEAIDWWMFEHSSALAARHFASERYLTLNVSPLHFRRADFCSRLLDMLQRTGLAPSRLVIEVTEGSLLDDPEGVRDILATLRRDGIGAALDDFGTGYSSLSYLHTFPLRIVKIDRSFVARLGEAGNDNSEAVVGSILALASALGVEALAEGIETDAQRATLQAMGCRFGQGYLLGRPAPVEEGHPARSP
jgi:diguanylate cyclase (GGDEF)-like protein